VTPDGFRRQMQEIAKRAEKDPEAIYEAELLVLKALKLSGYVYGAEIFEKMKKHA
jgi:hypothetical protein